MPKQHHSGHRERLRRRFLTEGLDNFEPHVILELILFFCIPRVDTNPIAHRLLDRFGSISGVLEASYEDLKKVEGVGDAAATLLTMIAPLTRRYLSDKFGAGEVLNTTRKLGEFLLPRFVGRNKEVIFVLCLDKKRKLLYCEEMPEGDLESVPINIRKIVETVVRVNASSVVLAHNHTQGFALPSVADQQVTHRAAELLRSLGVELVDHIIVARDDFISMADSGMLRR